MMYYETILIGGGASGLFFSASVPSHSSLLLLEKSHKLGTKLLMTGAGQCNITHSGSIKEFLSCYGDHGEKIRKLLYSHSNLRLCQWLEDLGIPFYEREDGKIFPSSLKAMDVRDGLLHRAKSQGVTIVTGAEPAQIKKTKDGFYLKVIVKGKNKKGETLEEFACANLVIASGGLSYPGSGSDGSIFPLLQKNLDIKITPQKPALTPVFVKDYPFEDLSGVSFSQVEVSIPFKEKEPVKVQKKKGRGGLLLSHSFLSGPVILNLSRYMNPEGSFQINFLYPLKKEQVLESIKTDAKTNHKSIENYLTDKFSLPKRFIKALVEKANIKEQRLAAMSNKELASIVNLLTGWTFTVEKLGGYHTSMVTKGGISLEEIHLTTMESTRFPNLYFIGEVVDIDGDTGGYNLQFCYSSALAAVNHIYHK